MEKAMELGVGAAKRAWAELAGLDALEGTRVFVDAESPLAPSGWIGILVIGDTVTACVPNVELEAAVSGALATLTPAEAVTPGVVVPRLPPTVDVLGPAQLFHPPEGYAVDVAEGVEEIDRAALDALLDECAFDEVDESGLRHVTAPIFGTLARDGSVASACGYRPWPNRVAHLSVITHPAHRREGHARRAATAAINHAIRQCLLPQWRARPPASQALARALGLEPMGAQLSARPATPVLEAIDRT